MSEIKKGYKQTDIGVISEDSKFTAILDNHIPSWRQIKDELNEFIV